MVAHLGACIVRRFGGPARTGAPLNGNALIAHTYAATGGKEHDVMQGENQERSTKSSQLPLTLHTGKLAWPLMAISSGSTEAPGNLKLHALIAPIGRDSKHRSVQYLLAGAHVALRNAVQRTPSEDFTALERRYGNPQRSYSRLADDDARVSTTAPCSMSMKESLKMSGLIESEFQQLCMKAAVTMG